MPSWQVWPGHLCCGMEARSALYRRLHRHGRAHGIHAMDRLCRCEPRRMEPAAITHMTAAPRIQKANMTSSRSWHLAAGRFQGAPAGPVIGHRSSVIVPPITLKHVSATLICSRPLQRPGFRGCPRERAAAPKPASEEQPERCAAANFGVPGSAGGGTGPQDLKRTDTVAAVPVRPAISRETARISQAPVKNRGLAHPSNLDLNSQEIKRRLKLPRQGAGSLDLPKYGR